MARALFVTPEPPYPLRGGGSMRSASLLHYLSSRYEVDAIGFSPNWTEALPQGLVKDSLTVCLKPHSRTGLARAWRNGGRLLRGVAPLSDRFSGYETEIQQWLSGRNYDVAVLEHFWTAAYLPYVRPHARTVVLDLHNIESVWHDRCSAVESGAKAVAFRRFSATSRRDEQHWLPQFDHLLVTSAEDARLLRREALVFPNAIPWCDVPVVEKDGSVAFSGNWEYGPNQTAVRWFLKEVWPMILRKAPGTRFRLVGRSPESLSEILRSAPQVETTGAVDDALPWIARASVAVVPILTGSGTRVKILEAWAAGVPVVSTPIGAEGLSAKQGQHLLLAANPTDFAARVLDMVSDPLRASSLAAQGRTYYEQRYCWPAAWDLLGEAGFL